MVVTTSRASRRLLCRLDRGEKLHEALVELARQHDVLAAQVRGTGVVDEVVLALPDRERGTMGEPRALRGYAQLVALEGSVAWQGEGPSPVLHATLARVSDNGIELLGGELVSARARACELVLECWDDVTVERVLDGATGLAVWSFGTARAAVEAPSPPRTESAVVAAPPPPPMPRVESVVVATPPSAAPATLPSSAPPPRTLVEAAQALEAAMPQRPRPLSRPPQPEPEVGDLLEHPSFGVVAIESEDDAGRLRIRLPSGSVRDILLEVFDVTAREPRDGKRLWALRPRKR